MEYALGGLVVAAALAFVVLPLVRGTRSQVVTPPAPTPAEARAEIYRELLEADLDHRVGKITDEDYRALSEALLARAASLISVEDAESAAADQQIEREIAAMRATIRREESVEQSEVRS